MGVELSIPIQTRSIRMSVNDVLAKSLADSLNKKFKDTNKVAYFLDGSDTTPTDIKEFISTGSSTLDLAISNRARWGYCSW